MVNMINRPLTSKEINEYLDNFLGFIIHELVSYHETPYRYAIHDIIEDCYRLQDRVREDLKWFNLTWTCEACRQERPDDKISVYHHPWNLGGHEGHQNLKYCNDNPHCLEMVKTHDLFELRQMANKYEK